VGVEQGTRGVQDPLSVRCSVAALAAVAEKRQR